MLFSNNNNPKEIAEAMEALFSVGCNTKHNRLKFVSSLDREGELLPRQRCPKTAGLQPFSKVFMSKTTDQSPRVQTEQQAPVNYEPIAITS